MKRLFTFLLFTAIILSSTLHAQIPPNAFNYSALARGPQGQPISSQNIGIRFSILKTTATGTVQYMESHQTTTDPFGLFNLIIGGGSVDSGNFASIDWGADDYFLKVELDAQGNINYYHMGTTQFLSVPYALYAGNSTYAQNGIDSVSVTGDTLYLSNGDIFVNSSTFSGDYNDLTNQPTTIDSLSSNGDTLFLSDGQIFVSGSNISGSGFNHYIGEEFGGGVIFHLWKDAQSIEHGLIVDLVDIQDSTFADSLALSWGVFSYPWSNITSLEVQLAQSSWDGLSNSNAIVAQPGHSNSAASLCLNSSHGGQSDWYLPSSDEGHHLLNNRFNINKTLSSISGASEIGSIYWLSSQYTATDAYNMRINLALRQINNKTNSYSVRAIRKF